MLGLIPFFLLAVPIAEITVFILVGEWIGLLATLGMILVTALLGTMLLRWQGFQVIQEIRRKIQAGEVPGRALGHGAMLLVAGVLLLTPGFVTDTVGFLLFIPQVREIIWELIKRNFTIHMTNLGEGGAGGPSPYKKGPTIDLDADEFGPVNPKTPWGQGGSSK